MVEWPYGLPPSSRKARLFDKQRRLRRERRQLAFQRVFLSSCDEDIAWSRPFVDTLRKAGADVWFDEAHRGSGRMVNGIEAELYRRTHVYVLTPSFSASPHALHEVAVAASLWKRTHWRGFILPVVARESPNQPELLRNYRQLSGSEGKGLAPQTAATRVSYILALDDPLGRPLEDPPLPPPPEITAEDAYWRGRLLYGAGTRIDALRAWDLAAQIDPTESRYWRERGEALQRLKRYDEALASLDQAVKLDPRNGGAWRLRSSALYYLGRYEESLNATKHAIVIDNHPSAWSDKIRALRKLGRDIDVQEALIKYERACYEYLR
jgi:tetratricopeptide (TPR) repeat protein